jgi:hypothetical protein
MANRAGERRRPSQRAWDVDRRRGFLSHLPLFGSPHDYQAIFEVAFAKTASDPQADYFADRKRTGTKIYTLEPERFVLSMLAAAAPLRSFKADVYRGHFERFPNRRAQDAARIAQDVDVNVTRVIQFGKFDPSAAKPWLNWNICYSAKVMSPSLPT